MMARANLGQLLGNVGEDTPPVAPKPEPRTDAGKSEPAVPEVPVAPAMPASRVKPAVQKPNAKRASEEPTLPAYLRYVRKETRLREDQQNQLTLQARRLNRAKTTRGARITENSLIRVAVDLFLAQADRAVGDDENAIRKSMTP